MSEQAPESGAEPAPEPIDDGVVTGSALPMIDHSWLAPELIEASEPPPPPPSRPNTKGGTEYRGD